MGGLALGENFDLLVVGAGPTGCVVAEQAAVLFDWSVLIVEKRGHIAGNCFDRRHESGSIIHEYGPHYYRTSSEEQIAYLSNFTDWIPGAYIVNSYVNGSYFPFPINLNTLEQFFGKTLSANEARHLLDSLRIPIRAPKNSEELVLSKVGRDLYEAFYLNYTIKQWRMHPRNLSPSVCRRIPIRLTRNPRYCDETFQVLPKQGYTSMFGRMIDHSNIELRLNCDYSDVRNTIRPRRATVYSGKLDRYFSHRYGRLPYRSLRFEHVEMNETYHQPCVQVNYPNDYAYTRSVEYKHLYGSESNSTLVTYEYPCDNGEAFYPVPTSRVTALANAYRDLAKAEQEINSVYFSGRLAEYRYLNMDEVIDNARDLVKSIGWRELARIAS
jgi:UDP-galactopyranose mutase